MNMMVSGKVILKLLLKVQKYWSHEVPLKVMELCVGTKVIIVDQLVAHVTEVLHPCTHSVCVYIYICTNTFICDIFKLSCLCILDYYKSKVNINT